MSKTLTAQDLSDTSDALNWHDVDGVMTHFADDCVFYTVGDAEIYGAKIEGAAAISAALSVVWAGVTDVHWDHHSHFFHGDRAVSEWMFSGIGADGMRADVQGANLFTLRDGMITVKQALRKSRPPFKA